MAPDAREADRQMGTLVGARFRRAGRVEYFDVGEATPAFDDYIVIEGTKGLDLARVALVGERVLEEHRRVARPICRLATPEDLRLFKTYSAREADALKRCREKIERHSLPMKLLTAEYAFDGSRLTFCFSSAGRVDFRELVRDLAGTFRTRIELRQVGPRDETRLMGGVGRCGRTLCCAVWLRDFAPVSMKMAKNQDLPLTDSRLAGICGRLMCCLAYENVAYSQAKQRPPCASGSPCAFGVATDTAPTQATCPRYRDCVPSGTGVAAAETGASEASGR